MHRLPLQNEKDLKMARAELKAAIKDKQYSTRLARLQAQIPKEPPKAPAT